MLKPELAQRCSCRLVRGDVEATHRGHKWYRPVVAQAEATQIPPSLMGIRIAVAPIAPVAS
jgi:hypothetical protein